MSWLILLKVCLPTGYLVIGLLIVGWLNSKSGGKSRQVFVQLNFKIDGWHMVLFVLFWPYYLWADYKYGEEIHRDRSNVLTQKKQEVR